MDFSRNFLRLASLIFLLSSLSWTQSAQSNSSSSRSSGHARKPDPALDAGSVNHGMYRNPTFSITCKIPEGWVLRTEDMNARDEDDPGSNEKSSPEKVDNSQRVLLAAFARPPQARGEDVNSSILIAAESVSAYPGLKDAAQYFGPIGEVAKAQGFEMKGDPYGGAIGARTVARADFQKDVGSRVMRQSTLVILAKSYVVSFTFIGGTEDEVDDLIDGLTFTGSAKPQAH